VKPFRKTIRSLVGFDRRERRGTFVLSLILATMLIVRFLVFQPGRLPAELPPSVQVNTELNSVIDAEAKPAVPFTFDPNTTAFEDLVRLGLTERQARTLVNYRNSGARFRSPDDLLRVYGIDSVMAARLIPYIKIARSGAEGNAGYTDIRKDNSARGVKGEASGLQYHKRAYAVKEDNHGVSVGTPAESEAGNGSLPADGKTVHGGSKTAIPSNRTGGAGIDINTCSAVELESLPGIGPVLAARIIRYRSLLGGFVEPGQLAEVYGLDSGVVKMNEAKLIMTYDSLRPLVLDSITFGDLAHHPYLGYDAARQITKYRSVTGQPLTLGEMVTRGVISPVQARRIAPYVKPPEGVKRSDYEFISSKVLK
jgi:DNA uptake protein ComE-like DNA-binding protein